MNSGPVLVEEDQEEDQEEGKKKKTIKMHKTF